MVSHPRSYALWCFRPPPSIPVLYPKVNLSTAFPCNLLYMIAPACGPHPVSRHLSHDLMIGSISDAFMKPKVVDFMLV